MYFCHSNVFGMNNLFANKSVNAFLEQQILLRDHPCITTLLTTCIGNNNAVVLKLTLH